MSGRGDVVDAPEWRIVERPVGEPLAGLVEGITGFERVGRETIVRDEIAEEGIVVVFNFGDRFGVDGVAHDSFIAGKLDSCATTLLPARCSGLELRLTPSGAWRTLGIRPADFDRSVYSLDEVLGRPASELAERLAEERSWGARFALIERALRRGAEERSSSPDAVYAWRRLRSSRGSVAVGSLARELGCSAAHLSRRFRDEIGITPKRAARLIRFRRAVDLLAGDDGRRFAEIAATCGYHDQSHMNRDFNEFAGFPPGDFVATRVPLHASHVSA